MKISEIVLFPAQLTEVETTKVTAEKKETTGREFDITAEVKGEIVDKLTGKTHIRIRVETEGFFIEVEKDGTYQFEKEIEDEKLTIQFLEVQGVRILWSYVREDIYSITSKMLPKPVMLPTIDVMKTLEKAE